MLALSNIANSLPDATSLGICALDVRQWYTGGQSRSSWMGNWSMMQSTANRLFPHSFLLSSFCATWLQYLLYDHTHFYFLSPTISVEASWPWEMVGEFSWNMTGRSTCRAAHHNRLTRHKRRIKNNERERRRKLMQGTRGQPRQLAHSLRIKTSASGILFFSFELTAQSDIVMIVNR